MNSVWPILAVVTLWSVLGTLAGWGLRAIWLRRRALDAVFANDQADAATEQPQGPLTRWLFLAGYRAPSAPLWFCGLTLFFALIGLTVAYLAWRRGAVALMVNFLINIPGGVGEVFLPLAYASPFLGTALLTALPALVVRSARRRRVQQVEQDLPITLDLLATLAEAGLGFDSAIDRILASQPPGRPLPRELRTFQIELAAGRPRITALRRLGQRLDVAWFNVFISAVIQAERVGAGLAEVVRIQAVDLRHRRRERALGFAMALPAKMTMPLVVCFLPAIAVVVLGPALMQLFQVMDGMLR